MSTNFALEIDDEYDLEREAWLTQKSEEELAELLGWMKQKRRWPKS